MDSPKNKKFRWGQLQFNLVNDLEQVVQFVWRGVAWRGLAQHCVSVRVYQYFGGGGFLQRL